MILVTSEGRGERTGTWLVERTARADIMGCELVLGVFREPLVVTEGAGWSFGGWGFETTLRAFV